MKSIERATNDFSFSVRTKKEKYISTKKGNNFKQIVDYKVDACINLLLFSVPPC